MIGVEPTMRSPLSHKRDYAEARIAPTMEGMSFRRLLFLAFAAVLGLLVVVPAAAPDIPKAPRPDFSRKKKARRAPSVMARWAK